MKAIIAILIGFATLIGSVATADDHKYMYVVSGMVKPPHGTNNVRIMNLGERQATVDIQVIDGVGMDVESNIDTITLPSNNMVPVIRSTEEWVGSRASGSVHRSIRITSSEELWILALKGAGGAGRIVLPVHSQVLPCSKRHTCDDKNSAD